MARKGALFFLFCLLFARIPAYCDTSASDEVMASLTKLKDLKSYRLKMTMVLGPQFQQEMEQAKQMGLDFGTKPTVQEIINPDEKRMTMEMVMPSMSMKPNDHGIKMFHANLIAVVKGTKGANYIDCKECEKEMDDAMADQLKKQAEQYAKNMVRNILTAAVGGPSGIATGIMDSIMMNPEFQAKIAHKGAEKGKSEMGLNRWKCREGMAEPVDTTKFPPIKDITALPDETVGSEPAKVYQFTVVDDANNMEMQVKYYASAKTGLPMKMEMNQQQGSMLLEYYDFDAPITIDIPDCMK